MSLRKSLLVSALVALCVVNARAADAPPAAAPALPVAAFFAHPQFGGALLSPDGANVAVLVRGPDGDMVLATMPAAGGPARPLAGIRGMDISNVHWVNNRRLVFSAAQRERKEYGSVASPGLHAINIDGSKRVHLVAHDWKGGARGNVLPPNTRFVSAVHDDSSSDVYVGRYEAFKEDFEGYVLFRLNTETANLVRVDTPQGTRSVVIDEAGIPRAATTMKDGQVQVHYNDPKTGAWRQLAQFEPTSTALFVPAVVTKSGQLYVLSNNGRNTRGLYRYDLAAGKLDPEPVIGLKQYDFNGSLIVAPDRETVLGARYETSEAITTWFDDAIKRDQQRIDALLPSTINQLSLARDALADAVVVYSYSDTEPGIWQLYHRATGKLSPLGVRMPALSPLRMASKSMVHFKARDGMDIPAYLTLPKGGSGKNLPMVVLVHGGPWVRGGHLAWEREAQFLASRGYAVLEPEYRGSTGFGQAHFQAGWKQWGLAMQDDVADAARWAIAQGTVDPQRICIAGASYGGYATLMGLVRNPELFRCGIDWVGVTDIDLLYDLRYTNTSQEAKTYGLPKLIGDQVKDAAQLKAASPLANASRITQPLLLAYGGVDKTVPIEHGKQFYNAVKKSNPRVEWVEYREEGHGWYEERTQVDFWGRVEKFLDQNIGKH
ncbi:MAG: prolyl oligopeptidase family serine peptidase [Pseudomonadota bacterium]|nr:prolyl oligopeptidase family serine peptidase [Pseudomonadota bacterium]